LNNTSVIKSTPSIYAWEDGNNIKKRENIEMNGLVYKPTRELGFYSVGNSQDLSFGNDRYIDFQIILTDEELTTLAGVLLSMMMMIVMVMMMMMIMMMLMMLM